MEILSQASFDKNGDPNMTTMPVAGTGPYQMKSRQQGVNALYERTPYKHWRVTPDFPEFEWRYMNEASSRMAALLTGEAHATALPRDLKGQAVNQGMKLMKGKVPKQAGNNHPNSIPTGAFETSDGYVNIGCGDQIRWLRLCKAMKRDDLPGRPEFKGYEDRSKNRDALNEELGQMIRKFTE